MISDLFVYGGICIPILQGSTKFKSMGSIKKQRCNVIFVFLLLPTIHNDKNKKPERMVFEFQMCMRICETRKKNKFNE